MSPVMFPSSGGQTLLQRTQTLPNDWQTSKTNCAPADRKSTTGREVTGREVTGREVMGRAVTGRAVTGREVTEK